MHRGLSFRISKEGLAEEEMGVFPVEVDAAFVVYVSYWRPSLFPWFPLRLITSVTSWWHDRL